MKEFVARAGSESLAPRRGSGSEVMLSRWSGTFVLVEWLW